MSPRELHVEGSGRLAAPRMTLANPFLGKARVINKADICEVINNFLDHVGLEVRSNEAVTQFFAGTRSLIQQTQRTRTHGSLRCLGCCINQLPARVT